MVSASLNTLLPSQSILPFEASLYSINAFHQRLNKHPKWRITHYYHLLSLSQELLEVNFRFGVAKMVYQHAIVSEFAFGIEFGLRIIRDRLSTYESVIEVEKEGI